MAQRGEPFLLDARALAAAGASQVLALDPAAMGSLMALQTSAPQEQRATGRKVGLLSIDGPLEQRAEEHLCGFADGYDAIAARFARLAADDEVGAIVLRVNSPGGDVAGLEEGVRRMQDARGRSGKKVFAFADEKALSAGYWLAAALADGGVYLPVAGLVGSIGVMSWLVDESKSLEAEGTKVHVIADPPGKAMGHPAAPISEEAVARGRTRVATAAKRFLSAMAAARGTTEDAMRALDGAVLTAEAAVAAGLANGIASFEDVLTMAAAAASEREATMSTNKILGLKDDASAADVENAVQALAADAALGKALAASVGTKDPEKAVGLVDAWKLSHDAGEKDRAASALEKQKAEAKERKELVGRLVVSKWETPATAWKNPTAEKAEELEPAEPWASMPITTLRTRVETLAGQPRASAITEVVETSSPLDLTAAQLEDAKKYKVPPEKFAKAKRDLETRRAALKGSRT